MDDFVCYESVACGDDERILFIKILVADVFADDFTGQAGE